MQFGKVLLRNTQQLPGTVGGLPVGNQCLNQDQLLGDGLLTPANRLLGPGYEFQSMDMLGDRRRHTREYSVGPTQRVSTAHSPALRNQPSHPAVGCSCQVLQRALEHDLGLPRRPRRSSIAASAAVGCSTPCSLRAIQKSLSPQLEQPERALDL